LTAPIFLLIQIPNKPVPECWSYSDYRPNRAAGIADRGFIKINEWMETAEPGIYAIGDIVLGTPQLAHVGAMEGISARYPRLPVVECAGYVPKM
jgi:hypothetical protein